jgi:hypothetical protein
MGESREGNDEGREESGWIIKIWKKKFPIELKRAYALVKSVKKSGICRVNLTLGYFLNFNGLHKSYN